MLYDALPKNALQRTLGEYQNRIIAKVKKISPVLIRSGDKSASILHRLIKPRR